MELRRTFQSLIALHQAEFPYNGLISRELALPLNSDSIVAVTGIRRCGKSSLLRLAINDLLASGIPKERILYIEFDDERFSDMGVSDFDDILQAYREMYPEQPLVDVYMFFDEIQLVKGWELFVLRTFKNYSKHIFITGSTAEMLSGEMASALRGWPDEYVEYPLDFKEYLKFRNLTPDFFSEAGTTIAKSAFKEFCSDGGFPGAVMEESETAKSKILQSYFNTMLFRDLIEHYSIKSSPSVVRYFLKRVLENITKPTSVNNIYNELKSLGMKVSKDSLYDWLDYACNIFLFYKIPSFTRSVLKESTLPAKYYAADHGLRRAVLSSQGMDEGKALENYIFLLLNRSLGSDDKIFYLNENSRECDFVILRGGKVEELIQVCWELTRDNRTREINGLVTAAEVTGCNNCRIITCGQDETIRHDGLSISVVSAWRL